MKQKLVFIGNSIVNGFPFSRGKSFPGLIRAATKEGKLTFSADVINKGENGQTTSDIFLRFDHDVIDHQPLAVFIMTGTNDFIFGEATSKEAFDNLEKMAAKATANGTTPVYMTPIRVDAEMASDAWMAGLGIDYDSVNDQVEEFSEMIRSSGKLCVDTNIAYQRYASGDRAFNGGLASDEMAVNNGLASGDSAAGAYHDGVHPTREGYAFLAGFVIEWIEEHKTELGLV